jgi:hypothetical protein
MPSSSETLAVLRRFAIEEQSCPAAAVAAAFVEDGEVLLATANGAAWSAASSSRRASPEPVATMPGTFTPRLR